MLYKLRSQIKKNDNRQSSQLQIRFGVPSKTEFSRHIKQILSDSS